MQGTNGSSCNLTHRNVLTTPGLEKFYIATFRIALTGWREMNWLLLINHGLHMPIYAASGPWFRKELRKMLSEPCACIGEGDEGTTTSSSMSTSQSRSGVTAITKG